MYTHSILSAYYQIAMVYGHNVLTNCYLYSYTRIMYLISACLNISFIKKVILLVSVYGFYFA